MIQLLIDECLSPRLVEVANRFGYLAFHVLHRGWKGNADPVLLGRLREESLTLVTNNWHDFEPMLRREEVHAGAIVIPNVPRAEQMEALDLALRAIQAVEPPLDMINIVIDVASSGEVLSTHSRSRAADPHEPRLPASTPGARSSRAAGRVAARGRLLMRPCLAAMAALGLALALATAGSAQSSARAGCRRVDAHARDSIAYMEPSVPYGAEYRCRLRAAGPVVRLFLDTDEGLPTAVRVYPAGPARGPLQVLRLDANSRPRGGGDPLDARDWNGDGWLDLAVLTDGGSAGNIYTVLTWLAGERRFVADTAVATLANPERVRGRPCIRWFWAAGMAGEAYTAGTTCWTGRRWLHERVEISDPLSTRRADSTWDVRYVRTLRARRGGQMRVVRVDTVRGNH